MSGPNPSRGRFGFDEWAVGFVIIGLSKRSKDKLSELVAYTAAKGTKDIGAYQLAYPY